MKIINPAKLPMRSLLLPSTIISALLIAYIVYAFLVPPDNRRPDPVAPAAADQSLAPLPLNATFTTAGRINFEDLTLSFQYPNFWEYGELHSDQVDATVRIIRPGHDPVHAGITLLVTRSPTALHSPQPLLPPGAKLLTKKRVPFGTTEMIFAEFVAPRHSSIINTTGGWNRPTRRVTSASRQAATGRRVAATSSIDNLRSCGRHLMPCCRR